MPLKETTANVLLEFTASGVVIKECSTSLRHLEGLILRGSLTMREASGLISISIASNAILKKDLRGEDYKPKSSKAEQRKILTSLGVYSMAAKRPREKPKFSAQQESNARDVLRKMGII